MDPKQPIVTAAHAIELADVIARIESSGNKFAMRFEPVVFSNLCNGPMTPLHARIVSTIQGVHRCNVKTAQVIYSTSWGLYQLMGFNLYDAEPLTVPVQQFCDDENLQRARFNAFVSRETINFSPLDLAESATRRNEFAQTYNGSLTYAAAIVESLQHFNFRVQ